MHAGQHASPGPTPDRGRDEGVSTRWRRGVAGAGVILVAAGALWITAAGWRPATAQAADARPAEAPEANAPEADTKKPEADAPKAGASDGPSQGKDDAKPAAPPKVGELRVGKADIQLLKEEPALTLEVRLFGRRSPFGTKFTKQAFHLRYGLLFQSPRPMGLAVYRSNETVDFDNRVVLDLDGDGSLDNDPILKLAKPNGVALVHLGTGAAKVKYALRLMAKENRLRLFPLQWRAGMVDLDGKAVRVAILDNAPYGTLGAGDVMLLDRDGDGAFQIKPADRVGEIHPLGALLLTGPRVYQVQAAPDGSSLRITPFLGEVGKLAFATPKGEAVTGFACGLRLAGGPGAEIAGPRAALPVTLPAGKHAVRFGGLLVGEEPALQFRGRLEVKGGETTTLDFGQTTMKVLTAQRGKRLRVGQRLTGPEGMQVLLLPVVDQAKLEALDLTGLDKAAAQAKTEALLEAMQRGPAVTIATADAPENHRLTGHMEYG